ncbi:hypothetical protein JXA84_03690 [candidate division WOR-3 bacterium]|nr:hypothetical protein [candidate division WOR-3 bacterium]
MRYRILFLSVLSTSLLGQISEDPEDMIASDEPFSVNAGMMTTQITGEGYVVHLMEGVRIVHGSAVITGDSGYADQEKGIVKVLGQVSVRDEGVVITSPAVFYYRDSRRAEASGGAKLISQGQEIMARKLQYDRNTRISSALEEVTMFDPQNNTYLFGDTGRYYMQEDYGIMTGNCKMLSISGDDTFQVTGDTMENFADSGFYSVTGNISVQRGTITAQSHELLYFPDEEKVVLFGRLPWISNQHSKIWGDSIIVWLDGEEIARLVSWINAGGTFEENQSVNQIYGDKITLDFYHNKPRFLEVIGRVNGSQRTREEDGI